MTVEELIAVLQRCPKDAQVLIVDPHHDYDAEPNGPYSDLQERIDNESTFDVRNTMQNGGAFVEIGSVLSQI